MNLYITTSGQYAGTQALAGKGHKAVEVPTDKAGLIAYLNGLCDAYCSCAADVSASPAQCLQPLPAPPMPPLTR